MVVCFVWGTGRVGEVGGVVDPKLVLEEELDVVPLFGKACVWVCCAEEM
jgi:hypothetical protein